MIDSVEGNKNLHELAVTAVTAVIWCHRWAMIIITVVMSSVGFLILSRRLHGLVVIAITAVII